MLSDLLQQLQRLVQPFQQYFDMLGHLKPVFTVFGVLTSGIAVLVILVGLFNGWAFLARYHYDGGVLGYLRTFRRFVLTFWASPKGVNSTKAARFLTEFEILDPPPDYPERQYLSRDDRRWDAVFNWLTARGDRIMDLWAWRCSHWRWSRRRWRTLRTLLKFDDQSAKRTTDNKDEAKKLEEFPFIALDNPAIIDGSRDEITRYFEVGNRFGADSFLSYVRLDDGYFAPLFLINGLMTRFDLQWDPIINNYRTQISGPTPGSRDLQELQSFEFNCWLLWGPSVPLCTCSAWRSREYSESIFYQYGFGDENNSIDVRITDGFSVDRITEVEARMNAAKGEKVGATVGDQRDVCATPQSLLGRIGIGLNVPERQICDAQQIIRHTKHGRVILTFDRFISREEAKAPDKRAKKRSPFRNFFLSAERRLMRALGYVRPPADVRQDPSYYYSAYIWVMFVVSFRDKEGNRTFLEPAWRNLLPFFEHGNIADATTMETLKQGLVAKACSALRKIFEWEGDKIVIEYACAFDHSNCGSSMLINTGEERILTLLMAEVEKDTEVLWPAHKAQSLILKKWSHKTKPKPGEQPPKINEHAACCLPEIVTRFYDDIEKVEEKREKRKSDRGRRWIKAEVPEQDETSPA